MPTQTFDVKVAANGRMVLPASVRSALGVHGDTRVTVTVADGEVTLNPMSKRILRAQELYRLHAKQAGSVDDFLQGRKEQQARRDAVLAGEGRP